LIIYLFILARADIQWQISHGGQTPGLFAAPPFVRKEGFSLKAGGGATRA
jgi:hypothetical protein